MHKRITTGYIKTLQVKLLLLQVKLLLLSAAKLFTLKSISHIKYNTLVNKIFAAIKCSVLPPDN